jgi:signal transduction histidine kinase
MAAKFKNGHNLEKILCHHIIHRDISKEQFIASTLFNLTLIYGYNRAAFYEIDGKRKYANPLLVVGPDTKEEHRRIQRNVNVDADQLLKVDMTKVEHRTVQSLEDKFLSHKFYLDRDSAFRDCFTTREVIFVSEKQTEQIRAEHRKLNDIFGGSDKNYPLEEYALIPVIGRDCVVGLFYVDYIFSRKSQNPDEPNNLEESIQHLKKVNNMILLVAALQLQTIYDYEQAEANKLMAAVGRSLSAVAHELKTPLLSIAGFNQRSASSLCKEIDDVNALADGLRSLGLGKGEKIYALCANLNKYLDKLLEYNSIVDVSAKRAANIVVQLLDLTNPGLAVRKYESINLCDAVAEALKIIQPKQGSYDNKVTPVNIRGESSHIVNAIINVIGNANDAIRENVERPDTENRIYLFTQSEVIDDIEYGCLYVHNPQYIPQDVFEQVFEPRFTTKDTYANGLGLFNVRKYMKVNHGMFVLDTDPYQGTIAKIILPLYQDRKRKRLKAIQE